MKDLMEDNKCLCCKTNNQEFSFLCANCRKYTLTLIINKLERFEETLEEIKKCV